MMFPILLFFLFFGIISNCLATDLLQKNYYAHPLVHKLNDELQHCVADINYCDENYVNISTISVKIANDYGFLLLHDVVQSILIDTFFIISPDSRLGKKISHIRASLAYSVGDFVEVILPYISKSLSLLTCHNVLWLFAGTMMDRHAISGKYLICFV